MIYLLHAKLSENEGSERKKGRPKPVSSLVARFEGRNSVESSERDFYAPDQLDDSAELEGYKDDKKYDVLPASEITRLYESCKPEVTEEGKVISFTVIIHHNFF